MQASAHSETIPVGPMVMSRSLGGLSTSVDKHQVLQVDEGLRGIAQQQENQGDFILQQLCDN